MSDQTETPLQAQGDTDALNAGRPPAKKMRLLEPESAADGPQMTEETGPQDILESVDRLQTEIDTLNEEASEEILLVEQKYNKLRKPHFDQRNSLIAQIPNFWITAFVNHPQISHILTEEEEECLHYLNKVEVEEFEDIKSGYRIKFHFQTNPYFDNPVLCKEFNLSAADDVNAVPVSISVPVQWKDEEMDLTKGVPQELPPGQNGQSGLRVPHQTFFTWYLDNADPATDDVAEIIKDDIWPNPLQYYLQSEADMEENGVDSDDEGLDEEGEVVIGTDDEEADLEGDVEDAEGDDDLLEEDEEGEEEESAEAEGGA